MTDRIRCGWVPLNKPTYVKYHDEEWGVPVLDDQKMFEFLVLESFQAGLSWEIVLNNCPMPLRSQRQLPLWETAEVGSKSPRSAVESLGSPA
jgi:hypothetical protein